MRLTVIYNPDGGRGRVARRMAVVQRHLLALGATVEPYATKNADDLARAAADASRDANVDRVVVCGGDGSLHHALRDFDLERGTLAMIPLGSGNDFARVCGLPRDIRRACELAVHGKPHEIDVALANGIRYLGVASLGFDAEVNEYANTVRYLGGSFVYLYATLRRLHRFRPRLVSIDGGAPLPVMFIAVGNSRQYGGGIRITPAAKLDDALLDACVVHEGSRIRLLMNMPRAYSGAHVKSPLVEIRRADSFAVSSGETLKVYADGEYMTTTPVHFGLEGRRLRFVPGGGFR